MKVSDFEFKLPDHLIAHYPAEDRAGSRLLQLDGSGGVVHGVFRDLLERVSPDDLMVFNNTRVVPARFYGTKATGGKVELLLERVLESNRALMQIRASKTPKAGTYIALESPAAEYRVRVERRAGTFFEVVFPEPGVLAIAEEVGHVPLPPYIERADEDSDRIRYQTVYAQESGAVAAPTAGLHFDDALMQALAKKGVDIQYVTLHVGAGTFQPVRVDDVESHKMHAEAIDVSEAVCDAVLRCRERGGRVIAVGTTSVRCLETASSAGVIKPFTGDTDIFIYPGYQFKSVDAMITNFHLPGSTLMMLVSAFAGIDNIRHAYRVAIEEEYRFFSYGDAMFLAQKNESQT